ncbi:unnamed protein product [Dibothriocephalus latus]|uniref:Protein kinase domain-containing protein n=1 Tax=Dibothriocephalus latus TaxID=60516 RepID=A0A3P6PSX8_DIBLA|nr:unnamed protein product [Dibothriocephalus latus]
MSVRWSAPEVLTSSENYSTKSDIWAYGIVLWEVYSLGHVPFFDIPNTKLSEALEKAFREGRCPLQFPDYTPKAVQRIGLAEEADAFFFFSSISVCELLINFSQQPLKR